MGIASEVYRVSREIVESRGSGRLDAVKLLVGELAAVEPELLVFAWEGITSGTADEGSRLEIEFIRARQTCAACGGVADRAAGSWIRLCPGCGLPLRVEGGDELDVVQVSFTLDESAAG